MVQKKTRRIPSSSAIPADIEATLGELGIDIDKVAGDEAWALCPGHEMMLGRPDHGASWSVNLTTGDHNCFSCGWGGNFVDLVRWQKDWENDPEQAEAWVRKHGGIRVASKRLRGETVRKHKRAEEVSDVDLEFLFEERIPRWALEERDLEQDSCTAYGVRWDPKRKNWIIPVRDPYTDKLMGWQAKGKGVFLNHPEHLEKAKALFGYHLLGKIAYLEESPLDCVRLHTYSVDGAVSGYGVHVSPQQMGLIIDKVDILICCLDNDAAGRAKERKIWKEYRHQTRLYFANYDGIEAKDHGEMAPEEIEFSIENPISSLRYRP